MDDARQSIQQPAEFRPLLAQSPVQRKAHIIPTAQRLLALTVEKHDEIHAQYVAPVLKHPGCGKAGTGSQQRSHVLAIVDVPILLNALQDIVLTMVLLLQLL